MTLDQEHLPHRTFQRLKHFIVEYREAELRTQPAPQHVGDRAHLAAIHRALYQDIYQQAGQPDPDTLDRANNYMRHVEKTTSTIREELATTSTTPPKQDSATTSNAKRKPHNSASNADEAPHTTRSAPKHNNNTVRHSSNKSKPEPKTCLNNNHNSTPALIEHN